MARWATLCCRLLAAGLAALCGIGACSSSGEGIKETRNFTDSQGRNCQASLRRDSAHAPAASEGVACDGASRQCSTESTPCFELSVATQEDGYVLRNCPACCLGTASSFVFADCNPVACTANADCVFALATCEAGRCVCANGECE